MKNITITLLVSLFSFTSVAKADVWAEREALAKIQSEVAAIEALVNSTKRRGNNDSRTTFDYQDLLGDLRKIQAGISNHLTMPMEPVLPSTINALEGDYTEHR